MTHHRPRPRDTHAPVREEDFLEGHALLHGVMHDDPKRLRTMMLDMLEDAFPFHPALPERILLRLAALSQMWNHPIMKSWWTPSNSATLGGIALRLAARHPLLATGWFDVDSFFAEMLRRMNGEGHA